MDVNFNSLVEEQKEPCCAGFIGSKDGPKILQEMIGRSINGGICKVESSFSDSPTTDQSLEKLAELTAAMNRFELDIVNAESTPRMRSKSEPSAFIGSPATVLVSSCEHLDENGVDCPTLSENCIVIPTTLTPPTATSERRRRHPFLPSRVLMNFSKMSCDDRHGHCRHFREQWFGKLMGDSSTSNDETCSGYIWNGEVPPRNYNNPTFSSKIFVGGVPWDITETALVDAFSPYGACRVEWPCKEVHSRSNIRSRGKATGYVYMVFEKERSVKLLLQDCSQEFGSAGEWYFKLKARRHQTSEIRQVQIIPWVVSDSSYIDDPNCRLDPSKTVFVGALHGMITAHILFSIMNELYDNVVFAGIDTDKHKYPIGSGRVTFRSHSSYFRAIESAFLEIRTSKFCKKVQIDPFLEDSWCMVCCKAHGPYFCRDRTCFRYYCGPCWQARHAVSGYVNHRPLMRHAPRSLLLRNEDHDLKIGPCNLQTTQRYLSIPAGVRVTPLGGVAAVAAVAHGTVPRNQHHAYQYMQLAPAYPTTVYTSAMVQPQCRVSSTITSTPIFPRINQTHPVSTSSSPYIHQRLY
ncbi:hypothetical protein DICVIV_01984 [Dictyocaulus viviparus]|uniref:RRM domain-containing protein n=1 Tax=Dictyocaulus viviparus TaxID=29172 RepID=A0A0D8Y4L7_DICVI|nr:hypothetical protein DICVIV_01984 [Dictyocaulus viviparus]